MKSLFSRDLRIVLTIAFLWLFLGNPQAKAANFVIGTASSTCRVGSSITLNILLNSPDIAANAVQGDITYHFDSLSLASINIKDTLIQFWVHTPVINNASGTVSFEGAIMTPGYLGKTGRILSLIFNCRQEGITPISFSSGSILANDGKGTSILDNLSSLNITILPQTTVTTKETGIVGGTKANPKLILELLTKQNTDPIVAFSFKLQGAENPDYYEVTIDNGIKEIWPTIKSASYETRVLSPGNHSIGVTAVYKNNYSLNATQDFVIEPLVVPIVKNLPSQINEDDILEFEVLTNYPEANIVLEFQPLKGGEAVIVNLITNSDGNLSVSLKNILSEGSYLIKTKVFLVNSASSQYSTPAILQVNLSKLNQIQLLASAYLKIIVLLAGIAVTLTVAILYILGRIRRYRKDYNRKVDEVFANLDTEGRHIIELSDDVTGMSDREQGDAEKYRDILTKNRQTLYPPKK